MRVRYVVSDSVPIHLIQASFHLISQHTRISIPMRQARSTIFNQAPFMAKSRSFLTRIGVGDIPIINGSRVFLLLIQDAIECIGGEVVKIVPRER
jgi:hypothetical protein